MHHLFFKEWLHSFTWRLPCWITAWVIVPPSHIWRLIVSQDVLIPRSCAVQWVQHPQTAEQIRAAAAVDVAAAAGASVWWQPAAVTLRLSPFLNPTAPSAGQMLSLKWRHCNKCLQQTCPSLEGGNHQHKERGIFLLSHDQLQKTTFCSML